MKKILIILDGLGDLPCAKLQNKTPLEVAYTPNLDWFAANGITGLLWPIKGIAPESGASQFVLLGYPLAKYPGRGPVEALGVGYRIRKGKTALRVNFAKIKGNKIVGIRVRVPSKEIIAKMNKIDRDIRIIPTLDYRAVMIVKESSKIANTHPGYEVYKNFSKAISAKMIKKSSGNKKVDDFIKKCEKTLNGKTLLIRGAGNKLPKLKKIKNWSMIADMPVEIGLARLFGMKILKRGKDEIKQAISTKTNVYVQIKGPDSFGHIGDAKGKVKAIAKIDKILKPLRNLKNTLLCITADHATPCKLKRHSAHPVPILIYGKGKNNVKKFNEKSCAKGKLKLQGKNLKKLIKP